MGDDVVGRGKAVVEEVVDEGAVAEHLVGLPEPEARRVEPHHLAVALLLLHPHRRRSRSEPSPLIPTGDSPKQKRLLASEASAEA